MVFFRNLNSTKEMPLNPGKKWILTPIDELLCLQFNIIYKIIFIIFTLH